MRELTKEERWALNTMRGICEEWLRGDPYRRRSPDELGKMIAATAAALTYPPRQRREWTDEEIIKFYANEGA